MTRGVWLLAVLAVILAVAAVALYVRLYRADQRTGDAVRAEVAQVAADGAAALLSYTPETVAADMYAATQRLTGDFREYYSRLTDATIVPTARAEKITTTATAVDSGIGSLSADRADALVFLKQVTSTEATPDPVTATVGARVSLTSVDGEWLISGLEIS
ncbi:twin-arginine translocation pathway signal [Rhodococcus sp. NPDC058532]